MGRRTKIIHQAEEVVDALFGDWLGKLPPAWSGPICRALTAMFLAGYARCEADRMKESGKRMAQVLDGLRRDHHITEIPGVTEEET